MKIYFKITFNILVFILLFSNCLGKKKVDNKIDANDSKSSSITSVTQYVNSESILIYSNPDEIGMKYNTVKDKTFQLNFGQSVTVLEEKLLNIQEAGKSGPIRVEKECFKIQLPDKSIWWGKKSFFSEKFIIINKESVSCFSQPEQSYRLKIYLDKGDFGKFVSENNNFINVDFFAYSKDKNGIKKNWVGNKWIKSDDFTDNIDMAKESFYLYLARYFHISGDDTTALKYTEKALEETSGQETDITPVVKQFIQELNEGTTKNNNVN